MNSNMWVIIFRGIPRTGKTTLAKILHLRLEDRHRIALIHYDGIFKMKKGEEKERLKHKIAMGIIEDFLTMGFNLILDHSFIFSQDIDQTTQLIKKYTPRYQIYLLNPFFWEIVERDKKFPAPMGIQRLKDYWNAMENNNFSGCIEIDTNKLSIDETVEFILNDMRSNMMLKKKSP